MTTGDFRLPTIDATFLRVWSPARFAVLGLALYAFLVMASPLQYDYSNVTFDAALYALAVLGAFFAGCAIAKMVGDRHSPGAALPVSLPPDRMINLTLAIGFIGVTARLYDRVVLRGFTIAETYEQTRETVAESLSAFSYIGGIGFSFGIVSLTLIWLSSSQRRRPFTLVLALMLALYPMFEGLVQGSRSTMIHTAFLFYLLARSSNAVSWIVRSRIALVAAGFAIVLLSTIIYEVRSLQGAADEVDISDVFRLTAAGQYAKPYDWVIEMLIETNAQGVLGSILKTWTHFTQYLTHSWLVYFDNYEQFTGVHGWGRIHLQMVFRLLSTLVGEDLTFDPGEVGMQVGLSTTAFSSIHYDFGGLGPLFAGMFGYLATVLQRKSIELPERWLPLYAYICFSCLMMMLDNQLLGSLGSFAVWSFGFYAVLHYLMTMLAADAGTAATVRATALTNAVKGLENRVR
jgi:hypothetical protein